MIALTTTALAAYLLNTMNTWVPQREHWLAIREPAEVTAERYERFAGDVAATVNDPGVVPLFAGEDGRARTGVVLVSIAFDESHYTERVMTCAKSGDKGAAWGPFQTTRDRETTCMNTRGAVVVALEMIRESFRVCARYNLVDRLAEYTNGLDYANPDAWKRSERKMKRAIKWVSAHPFPELGEHEPT